MKNLIICGLNGTGKTTIAKHYSEELGYEYIDLYDVINSNFYDEALPRNKPYYLI